MRLESRGAGASSDPHINKASCGSKYLHGATSPWCASRVCVCIEQGASRGHRGAHRGVIEGASSPLMRTHVLTQHARGWEYQHASRGSRGIEGCIEVACCYRGCSIGAGGAQSVRRSVRLSASCSHAQGEQKTHAPCLALSNKRSAGCARLQTLENHII
eukprot:15276-Prymnesium_polylepis.1